MRRDELEELHYITPISNVASILAHGILSHRRAAPMPHRSVAMAQIQDRRRLVRVPSGRPLHEYANLYICARNPMMYSLKEQHPSLCVLRVSTDVLDLPGVVVTDRNAASDYVRFGPAPAALALVDRELVFARYWTHGDLIEAWRRKSIKCAEVLVPDRVDAMHVSGAYVSSRASREALIRVAPRMPIAERPDLFFR